MKDILHEILLLTKNVSYVISHLSTS
jgi:hypothetical protein